MPIELIYFMALTFSAIVLSSMTILVKKRRSKRLMDCIVKLESEKLKNHTEILELQATIQILETNWKPIEFSGIRA